MLEFKAIERFGVRIADKKHILPLTDLKKGGPKVLIVELIVSGMAIAIIKEDGGVFHLIKG